MKISTTHILLPAFNFNGQSWSCLMSVVLYNFRPYETELSQLNDRWLLLKPELLLLLIVNALQLNELSVLRNTFYPEYKYEFHTVYWTARDEKNAEKIFTVKYTTYAVVKRKPEKGPTLSAFKAPFGFLAQLIRALHQYRRGKGSSPGKAKFFPGFLFAVA